MKYIFFNLALFSLVSIYAQKETKFNYFLSVGINNGFVEERKIEDNIFFSVKDFSPGLSFGGGLKHSTGQSFRTTLLFNLLSFESVSYNYYGVQSRSIQAFPQLILNGEYKLTNRNCNNILLYLGTGFSFNFYSSKFITEYTADLLRPNRKRVVNNKDGLYPFLVLGGGFESKSRNDRIITYSLFFHKGFHNRAEFTLERLDFPYLISTFSFKGRILKLQVNWFFKSKSE